MFLAVRKACDGNTATSLGHEFAIRSMSATLFGRPSATRQALHYSSTVHSSQHKPWYARFGYFPIYIPSSHKSRLTPRQNALYWLIGANARQKQVYYSMCLGIDVKTVGRAIETLRILGLVSWSQLEPLPLSADHLALWQDKAKRKLKSNEFQLSQSGLLLKFSETTPFQWFASDKERNRSAYEQFCERLDEFGNRMRAAGYSTVEITAYWDQTAKQILLEGNSMAPLELFVLEFRKLFAYVEATTLRNRAAGLFGGSNSLGLLKTVTRQATEQLKVVSENHRTYGGLCIWSWSPDP